MQTLTRRCINITTPNGQIRSAHGHAIIIGGGPVGAVQALALAQQGISSQIFEQSSSSQQNMGTTFSLSSGTVCLRYLGLKNKLFKISSPIRAVRSRSARRPDKLITDVNMEEASQQEGCKAQADWYRIVLRSELHDLLLDECKRNDLISYENEKRFVEYSQTSHQIIVHFDDGSIARGDIGIAADGSASHVRRYMRSTSGEEMANHAKYTGIHCIGDLNAVRSIYESFGDISLLEIAFNNGTTFIPHPKRDLYALNLVFKTAQECPERWDFVVPSDDVKNFISQKGYTDELNELACHVTKALKVGVVMRPQSQEWSDGRMILIGDAAHPMFSFSGQGINQGLPDAICLAHVLSNHGVSNYEDAFRELQRIRHDYVTMRVGGTASVLQRDFGTGWWPSIVRDWRHSNKEWTQSERDEMHQMLMANFDSPVGFDMFKLPKKAKFE